MAETEVDYNPFEKKNETPVDYNPFANNGHAEWLKQHEERMRAAGVGQPQRPGLQATEEPMALPKPLIERLTAGARLTALFKGLGEGATEGFGHETVGLKPDELKKLREWGYLTDYSKGRVRVQDDDSVIEIQDKGTGKPLLALMLTKTTNQI